MDSDEEDDVEYHTDKDRKVEEKQELISARADETCFSSDVRIEIRIVW